MKKVVKKKTRNPVKKKLGQKSAWEAVVKDNIDEMVNLYKNGATKKQVAECFGIAESTLYKCISEHKELSERLARARLNACDEVRGAMFRLAVGYKKKRISKRIMPIYDKDGNKLKDKFGKDVLREISFIEEIDVEPNVNAQLAYLKNVGGWSDNPVVDNAIAENAEKDKEYREKMFENLGIKDCSKMRSCEKDVEDRGKNIVTDDDLGALGA